VKVEKLSYAEILAAMEGPMEEPAWCDWCNEWRDCGNNDCPECGNELMAQFKHMEDFLADALEREATHNHTQKRTA